MKNDKSPFSSVGEGFEAFILVDESINKEQLIARFKKELASETAFVQKANAKLNGKFAENAPKDVVEAEKLKRDNAQRRIEKISSYIEQL